MAAIAALITDAFRSAPHSGGNEADIVAALRADEALALSLVAESDGEVLGHIAFSPVLIDGKECGWFGLGPVAVHPEQQRLGIGARLIEHGLDRLRGQGADGCVVLGDPAYYARFGFRAGPELVLPGVPPEYFQSLAFGRGVRGTVAYHPAFSA